MTQATQRLCATLSSLLLVLSCWLPTLSIPQTNAASPAAGEHLVFASASPIVLM